MNLVIDGELAKHAVSEGTKAVAKLGRSGSFDSRSQRAGLVFVIEPVAALLQGRATIVGGYLILFGLQALVLAVLVVRPILDTL